MIVEKIQEEDLEIPLERNTLKAYGVYLFEKGYSIETMKCYHRIIYNLMGKPADKQRPNKITSNQIKKFVSKKEGKNMKTISAIKKFLNYLKKEHQLNIPPIELDLLKLPEKIKPPAPTKAEVKEIIAVFEKEKLEWNWIYNYPLFIEAMFRLGTRINELIKLRVIDVQWEFWKKNKDWGTAHLLRTKGNKARVVNVPTDLMFKFENQKGSRPDDSETFLFDFGYETYCAKKFKKAQRKKKALLQGDKRSDMMVLGYYVKKCFNDVELKIKSLSKKAIGRGITSHELRAAKITDLDNIGVPLSKIKLFAGHKNISTTNIYLRSRPEELQKILKEKDSF